MARRAPGFSYGQFTPASPGERDPWGSVRPELIRQGELLQPSAFGRWIPRLATAGVTAGLGAAAAPFLLGAGGAAGAASSGAGAVGAGAGSAASGATVGGAAAGRWTLGNILKMAELGVPAVTGLFGMRSQNRALDRQAAAEQAAFEAQMTFAREQEAQRRADAERMFIEDQRRWEAEERNRGREIASAEEERGFNRRLIEEREARRAPLRAAAGPALIRLQQIMAMGRRR